MPMYSKQQSKVRLELSLVTGQKETWYSMFKDDKKSLEKAIEGMTNRILKKRHNNTFKLAIFFNNELNIEIKKIGTENVWDKEKSLIKLVIYLKNGKREIWHSYLNNDKIGLEFSADELFRKYVNKLNYGKYETVLMYMNRDAGYDNTLIHKWIDGTKIF